MDQGGDDSSQEAQQVRRVVLESPYAGDVEANLRYARACITHSVRLGEAPIASHLLFTQPGILDDNHPGERAMGIGAGHAWIDVADKMVVYTDRGISKGMLQGIAIALDKEVPVELRSIKWDEEAKGAVSPEQLASLLTLRSEVECSSPSVVLRESSEPRAKSSKRQRRPARVKRRRTRG
jgi:hypothetical protein